MLAYHHFQRSKSTPSPHLDRCTRSVSLNNDVVGIRLTQQSLSISNSYNYNDANRLTSVGGATYTWDDNGNLLNDGVNTYTYDHSNRLKTVASPTISTTYAYNGLGDRVQQTVNGVPETYLLDLASGLTQVLEDGTNAYLYGVGRISQQGITVTEYFLGDALGSVRQLVDEDGQVILAKSYEPYGQVLYSGGDGVSSYGYTDEWTGTKGLVYLRSRYYAPGNGRFISRDTWEGDRWNPLSLNRWIYVQGNPINFSDPTGYIKQGQEAKKADGIQAYLESKGLLIEKDWGEFTIYAPDPLKNYCGWNPGIWKIRELELIEEATNDVDRVLKSKILAAIGRAEVKKNPILGAMAPPGVFSQFLGDIDVDELGSDELRYKWEFAHEFGHVWDYRSGNQLSFGLMKELGTWICINRYESKLPECFWNPYYSTNDPSTGKKIYPEPPPDTYKFCPFPPDPNDPREECRTAPYSSTFGNAPPLTDPGAEDWANSFAYFVYRSYRSKDVIGINYCPIRRKYVQKEINNLY